MSTETDSPDTREFAIDDVITGVTGRLVSRRHVDALYDLYGFMTGERGLMTHQLPRAARECDEALREQFPDLVDFPIPDWDFEGKSREEALAVVTAWAEGVAAEHGPTRVVRRLAVADHTRIDPLTEFAMLRPDAAVIPVVLPDEESDL